LHFCKLLNFRRKFLVIKNETFNTQQRWHSLSTELKTKIMKNIKIKEKLSINDYLKVTIFVVTFLIAKTIFSDWEHFKAGLFGL